MHKKNRLNLLILYSLDLVLSVAHFRKIYDLNENGRYQYQTNSGRFYIFSEINHHVLSSGDRFLPLRIDPLHVLRYALHGSPKPPSFAHGAYRLR